MSAELSGSLVGNYGFQDVIIWQPRPAIPSILIFASPLFPACLSSLFELSLWKAELEGGLIEDSLTVSISKHGFWLEKIADHFACYYCVPPHNSVTLFKC